MFKGIYRISKDEHSLENTNDHDSQTAEKHEDQNEENQIQETVNV